MSNYETWVRGCEINGSKLYRLEGSGDTALYKCWKDFIGPDHHEYHETPVYIGWVDGKEVCATTNYLEALTVWRNRMKAREAQ